MRDHLPAVRWRRGEEEVMELFQFAAEDTSTSVSGGGAGLIIIVVIILLLASGSGGKDK